MRNLSIVIGTRLRDGSCNNDFSLESTLEILCCDVCHGRFAHVFTVDGNESVIDAEFATCTRPDGANDLFDERFSTGDNHFVGRQFEVEWLLCAIPAQCHHNVFCLRSRSAWSQDSEFR